MPELTGHLSGRVSHGTVRDVLSADKKSALARYRQLTFADATLARFVLYELCTMILLPMPGALGLFLRRKLLRRFFGGFGRNVIIGSNCTFRQPNRIFLGDSVTIDDGCLLDARGCTDGLRIGAQTIVSRDCVIKSKAGNIDIGRRVNIGGTTHLVSHSGIKIGDAAAIAGGCHLTGGTFGLEELSKPPSERTPISNGAIEIGAGAWLATGTIVLDGVHIGAGSVLSAGSVATHDVEPRTVAQGNPAKKVFALR